MNKDYNRRRFMRGLLAFAGLALLPLQLFARNIAAFNATSADLALAALFGNKEFTESDQVLLKVPDIAENGAVVPVTVTSQLQGVKSITILVAENPNPLSASFRLMPGIAAEISTRIKMGKSSDVLAVVETEDGIYVSRKNVKVTIGGCGG